jgi:hypothetical protein
MLQYISLVMIRAMGEHSCQVTPRRWESEHGYRYRRKRMVDACQFMERKVKSVCAITVAISIIGLPLTAGL